MKLQSQNQHYSYNLLVLTLLVITLLSGCKGESSQKLNQQNPVAQTQQGIDVGLNIYDPRAATEQISEQQKSVKVVVNSPDFSQTLKSPVNIHGVVSGVFFSEGVFPVILKDKQGKELARTLAHADGEWMTDAPVPFTAQLEYKVTAMTAAQLIFTKDNSSGLPQNDQSQSFDVILQ